MNDETRDGHCQRYGCSNEGELHLIEMDSFRADRARGVVAGERWYCDECFEFAIEIATSNAVR